MNPQPKSDSSGHFAITVEIAPEDPHDADSAMVDAVGRDTAEALLKDNYSIEPVYTGQRGGFLIDALTPILTTAWAQKDIILADGSALVSIFTPVVLIAKHMQEAYAQRNGKNTVQQSPIKITAEIDGASISIEAPDLETAEAAMKLARRFQAQYPAVASQVTNQSNAKLKGSVSKKLPRKRR